MKKTLIAAAAIALASPAATWAAPPSQAGGPHGTPPGLTDRDDHPGSTQSPAAACFEERADLGASKFNDEYGTNANDRNAFGKCVAAEAQKRNDD